MWIKFLLSGLIVAFGVLIGYLAAGKYRARMKFYAQFSGFNERYLTELSYARKPFRELIAEYPYSGEFASVLRDFSERKPRSKKISFLTKEEFSELNDYFSMLGKGDSSSQTGFFTAKKNRFNGKEGGDRTGGKEAERAVPQARLACGTCDRHLNRIDMDISIIFKLAAIGIIITVVCQVLKKSDREDISTVVTIVGLVIALTVAVTMIGDLFQMVQEIFGVY